MGKSTVGQMFIDRGVPVWDADAAVHRLYAKGGEGVDPVTDLYPAANKDGAIDREALREWMLTDDAALSKLAAVVHPLVANDRQEFINAASDPILVFDIPLLYETGAEDWLDAVAVVSTDAKTQRARVLKRPAMTEERLDLILKKQTPDAEKRKLADFVIPSDTLEGAARSVDDILASIRNEMNA